MPRGEAAPPGGYDRAMANAAPHTTASTPDVCIALDVTNLENSQAFFAKFGFQIVHVHRDGLLLQERHYQSTEHCGVRLILREAFGKRTIGSQPGTLLRIAMRVPDLAKAVRDLGSSVCWVGAAPDPEKLGTHVRCTDPDGYQIELYQTTPGSGF